MQVGEGHTRRNNTEGTKTLVEELLKASSLAVEGLWKMEDQSNCTRLNVGRAQPGGDVLSIE